MKFNFSIARAAMTALFIGASAQATIINEFTTLGAWTAATTGSVTSQDFTGTNDYSGTSGGVTYGSVNYTGFYNESTTPGYFTYRLQSPTAPYSTGTGSHLIGGSSGGPGDNTASTGIRANLMSLSNITALAFNFSGYKTTTSGQNIFSTAGTPLQLTFDVFENNTLTDSRTLTIPAGSLGVGFLGITTTSNITGIALRIFSPSNTEQNRVILDNFAYATAAGQAPGGGGEPGGGVGELPEPSTYLLCGAALLGVAFLKRKVS